MTTKPLPWHQRCHVKGILSFTVLGVVAFIFVLCLLQGGQSAIFASSFAPFSRGMAHRGTYPVAAHRHRSTGHVLSEVKIFTALPGDQTSFTPFAAFNTTQQLATPANMSVESLYGPAKHQKTPLVDPMSKHLTFKNTVIIHGKHRTGSTFTSEFLRNHEEVFYMFEPFNLVGFQEWLLEGSQYLKELLQCNFRRMRTTDNPSWLSFVFCHPDKHGPYKKICSNPARLSVGEQMCRQHSHLAVKLIRMERIEYLYPFMQAGAKVVHLVRDPRGVMSSRLQYDKSYQRIETLYSRASEYCSYILHDTFFVNQKQQTVNISGSYILLRYEDAVYQTRRQVEVLYEFLGFAPDDNVENLVRRTEKLSGIVPHLPLKESPLGTVRNNPKKVPEKWRKHLSFLQVSVIQKACRQVMDIFGYRLLHSEKQLRDLEWSVVTPAMQRR